MLQKDSAEMSRVSKFVIAQVGNPANFLEFLLTWQVSTTFYKQ